MGLVAGEVDEELLARPVLLAHRQVEEALRGPVVVAELAVGVPVVGVGLFVLEPQQHQRHPGPAQLAVHLAPVGDRAGPRRRRWLAVEQRRLECRVVEPVWQRPGEPGLPGPAEVVGHRRERDAERRADLAARQTLAPGQPQDVADLAHGETGSRHSHLLGAGLRGTVAVPLSSHADPYAPSRVYENLRNGCTEWARTGVRNRPESAHDSALPSGRGRPP